MDERKVFNENGEIVIDDDTRISHKNMLWFLYRLLGEEIITTEELASIGPKIH